ncbi:hypothetical protein [Methylobacterium sp. A54F]
MTRYISRGPATQDYYSALGQAMFVFSCLEWNLVCIALRIDRDFADKKFYKSMTSWKAYEKFRKTFQHKGLGASPLEERLLALADEFSALVKRRNDIVHSQPATGADGSAMLSRYQFIDTFQWAIADLDAFTQDAENLSMRLNHILHYEMPC